MVLGVVLDPCHPRAVRENCEREPTVQLVLRPLRFGSGAHVYIHTQN